MLSRLVRLPLTKRNCFPNLKCDYLRAISTSKKNSEATTASPTTADEALKCEAPTKRKYWQSYGFTDECEKEDTAHMHISFFLGITMCIMFTSFYVAYAPDRHDWEQREAFLELRRREQLGLPAVDPNYIDPSLMILPSDEELGDAEVII